MRHPGQFLHLIYHFKQVTSTEVLRSKQYHLLVSSECLTKLTLLRSPMAYSILPLPTSEAPLDTAKRGPRPVQVSVSVQPAHLLPLTPLNCHALAGMEWAGRIRWDGESAFTPVQAGAVAQQSHIKSSIILLA